MRTPASRRSTRLALGLVGASVLGVGLVGSALASAAPKRPASAADRAQKSPSAGKASQAAAGSDASSAAPPAATQEKMICRGPFQYNASGWISVFARRSAVAAGPWGDALAPGECAFVDRALQDGEAAKIQFTLDNVVRPDWSVVAITAGLATCALDPKCLMHVRVERSGGGWQYTGGTAAAFMRKGVRAQ